MSISGDLIGASIKFQPPTLPNYWTATPSMREVWRRFDLQPPVCLGSGFRNRTHGGLLDEHAAVFVDLCEIDRLMTEARIRKSNEEQKRLLVNVRNAAQHRLLSLPPLEEADCVERHGHLSFVYECCRITTVLYSNAVIFPLPLNTGWHTRLIAKLQSMLAGLRNICDRHHEWSLLVWCLVIGAVASFGSGNFKTFEDHLYEVLPRVGLTRWRNVEDVLEAFIWSKEACKLGATMLWNSLEVRRKAG
jgi:hypothetical protein